MKYELYMCAKQNMVETKNECGESQREIIDTNKGRRQDSTLRYPENIVTENIINKGALINIIKNQSDCEQAGVARQTQAPAQAHRSTIEGSPQKGRRGSRSHGPTAVAS